MNLSRFIVQKYVFFFDCYKKKYSTLINVLILFVV